MRGIAAFQLDEIQRVHTNTVHCFNQPVNLWFFPLWHLPAIRFKISPNSDMPSFDRDRLSKKKYILRVSSTNHNLHSWENKKQRPAPPLLLYYLSFSENVNLQKSFTWRRWLLSNCKHCWMHTVTLPTETAVSWGGNVDVHSARPSLCTFPKAPG